MQYNFMQHHYNYYIFWFGFWMIHECLILGVCPLFFHIETSHSKFRHMITIISHQIPLPICPFSGGQGQQSVGPTVLRTTAEHVSLSKASWFDRREVWNHPVVLWFLWAFRVVFGHGVCRGLDWSNWRVAEPKTDKSVALELSQLGTAEATCEFDSACQACLFIPFTVWGAWGGSSGGLVTTSIWHKKCPTWIPAKSHQRWSFKSDPGKV